LSDQTSPTVDTPATEPEGTVRQESVPFSAPFQPLPGPTPGSLEERVGKRREQLEKKTTEMFDVPGYEGVFQVELRLLGGKRQFAIVEALERVHDDYQKAIRAAAEMILASTVAIHEVVDDEGNTQVAEGVTWLRLAKAADQKLGPEIQPRVALIRMISENGVLELAGEWRLWMKNRGVKVEKALARDF
jgi:hypothetical protein